MEPLTPSKIQRLLHLAEDSSYNGKEEFRKLHENIKSKPLGHYMVALQQQSNNQDSGTYESSSGVLDLDQIQGFGESEAGSIGKATGFFPGEMTGRSTGAEDHIPPGISRSFVNLEDLTKKSNMQSNEVNHVMRHSIADTNFSVHSKNLTASEASFAAKYGTLPVQMTHTVIPDTSMIENLSVESIGGYFRKRCPEFNKVLGHTDSPSRSSMQPSLTEVSLFEQPESLAFPVLQPFLHPEPKQYPCNLDPSLDNIPVRQPRVESIDPPEVITEKPPSPLTKEKLEQLLMDPNTYTTVKEYRVNTESMDQVDPFKTPQSVPAPRLEPQKPKPITNDLHMQALMRNSMKLQTGDESSVVDNSFSLSKLAELIENQSIVNVSDIIDKLAQPKEKKKPLVDTNKMPNQGLPVTYLKDTRNLDSANSAGSVETVISMKSNQEKRNIPVVTVTRDSLLVQQEKGSIRSEHTRSKSPSSKSRSTLSTVKENYAADSQSPARTCTGEVEPSHVPSPNFEYKELDKSVDWQELLQARRRQSSLAKGPWVEIKTTPVNGFVGVNCPASISITTKSDNFLTATFTYSTNATHLRIETPRQPLVLSPGKTDLVFNITSSVEITSELQYTIIVKDSSIDWEQEKKGTLQLDFKMPQIQAISSFGPNKVVFSPTQERTLLATTLVLLNDSPVDLQLSLSLVSDNNVFFLKNVQEIKISEVNKALVDKEEKYTLSKLKRPSKPVQLCLLTKGNAIRATMVFQAPTRKEQSNELDKYHGTVTVKLIGVDALLKTVELSASVGAPCLRLSTQDKLTFSKEPKILNIHNTGSLRGVWNISLEPEGSRLFTLSAMKVDVAPGEAKGITVTYNGPEDSLNKAILTFEEVTSCSKTSVDIQGGTEKFPIKTSNSLLSWVRSGRKEVSLKNYSDKKVTLRCDIKGDAYTIDVPGVDARGTSCIISFAPNESKQLSIIYTPTSHLPNAATLFMRIDKNSDTARKIGLYGCASADALRWVGVATYGETALVCAIARTSIDLKLTNKSPMPAFVCAKVNFTLHYTALAGSARLSGARHVVLGRGAHTLALRVDWPRVERRALQARAPTLATLTAITGPELTRQRILRILRHENNGELDTSLLPENLKMLVGSFEGEEVNTEALLADFHETKASLSDLIGGLQELNAQIDLPVDFSEETIIVADDTVVVEHHTLCE